MSTSQDLQNNKKSNFILRKAFQNKGTINVNIPLSVATRADIKPQDYLICEYNDQANRISFTKLELKSPTLAKLIKEEGEY